MKLCPKCKARYEDNIRFCSDCGTLLIDAEPEETAAAETPAAPETPAPETAAPVEEAKPLTAPAPAAEPEKESEPPVHPAEEKKTEAAPEKKEKPAREVKTVGTGRRILSVLLCVLLFVFLLAPALGFYVRRSTREDGMQAVLESIDVGSLRVDAYFDDVTEKTTLAGLLSQDLAKQNIEISEKSMNKVIRNSTLKYFFAGELADLFEDLYSGRGDYEFELDKLANALTDTKTTRVLEKEGYTLSDKQAQELAEWADGYKLTETLNLDYIKDEAPQVYNAVHYGLHYVTLGALLAVALLLIILIFRANRGRFGLSLGDIGTTLIVLGALLTLSGLLGRLLPELWTLICAGETLVGAATGAILFHNILISLIVLGAGIVLAVIGRLIRGRQAKNEA